jgi:hypothetical protein
MDSVRFGRALGFGARSAARALAGAVDAATAPNPTPVKRSPPPAQPAASRQPPTAAPSPAPAAPPHDPVASAARTAARVTVQAQVRARETSKGLARGSKRFGDSVWSPIKRLSGVLWLEMTGAFFGIFALFAGQATWTHRADLRATPVNHEAHIHALAFVAMAAVFGYFCISSFVRAYRR